MSRKSRERAVSGGRGGARGARGVVDPQTERRKLRGTRLREREKGGRASRAPERGQRSYFHGAQIEAEAVEREVGRVRVHHLSCGRAHGGEGVRRGIFTKTTDGKARVAKFRPSPRAPIASSEARPGELLPGETKHSLSRFFSKSERSRKCKLSRENNSKAKPLGASRSSLNALEVVHRTWHESGGPALRARARRETPGTARDARSTDG